MRSLILLVAVSALVRAVDAQCAMSRGMFVGTPAAMSLRADPLVPFAPGNPLFKAQGFHNLPPAAWTPIAGRPDFRIEQALMRLTPCAPTRMPDIDAMSIGLDWILADDATGQVAVPADRWGAVIVSARDGSRGRPGSVIAQEAARADGVGADVLSYALEGSALPPELVARTERAHDSREIDLGDPAQARRDVDAIDLHMSLYALANDVVNVLPPEPCFYFSVSRATLNDVPASWWRRLTNATPPSGATILKTRWTRRGGWSCPTPYKTFAELGLRQGEDIDALAIDIPNQRILLSTTTSTRDPLLFVFCGGPEPGAEPVPYTDGNGNPVSDKIGLLEDDDFDAVCAIDPSVRGLRGGGTNPYFFHMGTPRPKALPPAPDRISASSFRDQSGLNVVIRSHMVGWAATGPVPGVAGLFISFPDQLFPLLPVALIVRNPAEPFCGDPVFADVVVPPNLSITGAEVNLRWFAVDNALTPPLGEAHPLLVHL